MKLSLEHFCFLSKNYKVSGSLVPVELVVQALTSICLKTEIKISLYSINRTR